MSRISRIAISQEGFVFDPATGDSFVANRVGAVLLQRLQGGTHVDELADELTSEYDVSQEQALNDVEEFLSQIRLFQFIE